MRSVRAIHRSGSIARVVSLTLLSSIAHADEEEAVVVTATRTEQPLSQVGQTITVIDSATIARRQSDTVVDLLRAVPGVTITRNGGVGTTTSVYIRGAENEQTVALIDGVKLNDPSAPGGGFNFGNLLVGNIAHIEVLRGSQSVLWGSQAIGGVVNLRTIEPTETLTANGRAEYGWRDTRNLVGNLSQKIGRVKASVGAGSFETDGISAFDETRGGGERDGYRNVGANANVNVEITEDVSVDVRGWYSSSKTGIDGFPAPSFSFADTPEFSRTREKVGYAAINAALFDGRMHNRLATTYTDTDRHNFDPDGFVYETFNGDGNNRRIEYQGIFDVMEHVRTTFGLENERSRFITSSYGGLPTRGKTRINSVYTELLVQPITGLSGTVGVRYDDHDDFGGKTTTGASVAYTPNAGVTILRASFTEGFKAPTPYQLQSEYGNLLLQPESARSFDAGLTQRFFGSRLETTATVFRRSSHDLINFVSCLELTGICAGRPFGTYDNVARARAQGVELELTVRPIETLALEANYTHVDAEDRSTGSATFGKHLVRRPDDTLSVLADYTLPFGLQLGATLTHASASFDNASNTRRVAGYDVVDLRVAYPLTAAIEMQVRIENLFDEKYETVFDYGTMRRGGYIGARFNY